jgi:four helix bundle protein
MQNEKIKSQNDKEKFKKEFKNRLYQFVLKMIAFIDKLPNDNVSRRMSDQLLRSGTSILANYIEAQASSSKKEFTNFFQISLKSCNESKVWFSLLKDSNRANSEEVNWFIKELQEIGNILATSVLTLKGKNKLSSD